MPYVLAKLNGVKFSDIEKVLKADAAKHAEQGLFLEHLWQNSDDMNEVVFLFKAIDLNNVKQCIESLHTNALKQDPTVNLPMMTFLE